VNGTGDFSATIRKDYFPYFITHQQGKAITIEGIELYDGKDVTKHQAVGDEVTRKTATTDLGDESKQTFAVTIPSDAQGPTRVLTRAADAEVFLIIRYSLS
jgi:hypothetical protein